MSKKSLEIVYRAPAGLVADERNSRTHSEAQIDQLAASIQRFGFTNPVALRDTTRIGAGHGRQMAALRILADPTRWGPLNTPDGKTVPTITIAGLSDAEWRAYVIADNRLAENAGWDFDRLKDELANLRLEDAGLANLAGFADVEIDALLGLGKLPTLEELAATHGKPGAADFWPEFKIKLPPALAKKLDSLMAQARPAGEDAWRRLEAVLDAVDATKLPT